MLNHRIIQRCCSTGVPEVKSCMKASNTVDFPIQNRRRSGASFQVCFAGLQEKRACIYDSLAPHWSHTSSIVILRITRSVLPNKFLHHRNHFCPPQLFTVSLDFFVIGLPNTSFIRFAPFNKHVVRGAHYEDAILAIVPDQPVLDNGVNSPYLRHYFRVAR